MAASCDGLALKLLVTDESNEEAQAASTTADYNKATENNTKYLCSR